MSLQSTALMGMMHEKMSWLTQRQSVLAQNMANSNTPGYVARDLKALDFKKTMGFETPRPSMARTHASHVSAPSDANSYDLDRRAGGYEISPDGNRVVIEEQMMKLNSTNSDHKVATNLYKKYMGLYRIALGKQ